MSDPPSPPARHLYVADRPVPVRAYGLFIGAQLVVLAALLTLATSHDLVERWFVDGFGSAASRVVDLGTGFVPFSLAEWVEGGVLLWLLGSAAAAAIQVVLRRRSPGNALAHGALKVVALASFAGVAFYGLWGLNYARAPAVERLGWQAVDLDDPGEVEALEALAAELVRTTNAAYRAVHGADDAGEPTVIGTPSRELDRALDAAYERVAGELGLSRAFSAPRGPAKPLLSSPVFSWLGIGGFYFPFTAEANVNTLPPEWARPHTIAHEKAHQRGIASEDEANFFGFLACIGSEHGVARYSGWLFAQRRILFALIANDPEAGEVLVERRLPGVQRDVDAYRTFWDGWQGRGTELGSAVNDAYLKTNRVEGGIRSYSLSARLIMAWSRQDPRPATVP